MNEGWASYWHSKLMTQYILPKYPCETVDYCELNASILQATNGALNPYRLGVRLFRDIEERWNKGRFGSEWESCRDMEQRRDWDKKLNLGQQEVMRAMLTHNDLTFIYEYLTPEFCAENKLHTNVTGSRGELFITSEDFLAVRDVLTGSLMNMGQPKLAIVNANHGNRGELVIVHSFAGQALDVRYIHPTCQNIATVWSRPVHVITVNGKGEKVVFTHDTKQFNSKKISDEFSEYSRYA
jgi:stage V sporulation protein R